MKGGSIKPYTSKVLLNAWRQLLEHLNTIKVDPGCDLDPSAVAEITDYLLDRIDAYRPAVAVRVNEKVSLKKNSLRLSDNPADNQSGRESENA